MEIAVETPKAGRISARVRIEPETILLHVPGRCSRIHIVYDKTKQVDQQECQRITEELLLVAMEQIPRKRKRQRYPAKVTASCHHIQQGRSMRQPVFIGRLPFDREELLFEPVDTFNMHAVVPVIGKRFHRVEEDPEKDKDRKTKNEPAGNSGEIEEGIEK